MTRYLNGVISGLKANNIDFEVVRPQKAGLRAKYFQYPLLTWKKRKNKGKHLIISERYAYLIPFMHASSIVVCHDLHTLYEQAKTPRIHQQLYRWFLNKMFKANHVICISEHTKSDLLRFVPKFSKHHDLRVIHNGIEPFWSYKERVTNSHQALNDLFESGKVLISIGTDAWYKNTHWSLMLLAELPESFQLLRIGTFSQSNEELIEEHNLRNRITQLEGISDTDLKFCYQNANALLFPSISEGFGWPACEAALSNCPVVANYQKPLSEVFPNKELIVELDNAKTRLMEGKLPRKEFHIASWDTQVLQLIL